MKKHYALLGVVGVFVLAYAVQEARSQQQPSFQIPEGVPSQESFDELAALVRAQTAAIQALRQDVLDLEMRVSRIEDGE